MKITEQIINSDNVKKTFNIIDSVIKDAWCDYCLDKGSIYRLKKHFTTTSFDYFPESIYNNSFKDYFLKYGPVNILKNYYLITELEALGIMGDIDTIYDIGSGPGIFSLALYTWQSKFNLYERNIYEVINIEPVIDHFNLFEDIWKNLPESRNVNISNKFIVNDFNGNFEFCKKNNLIILSNSLAELLRDKRFDLNDFIASIIKTNAIIVIIDYGYDELFPLFDKFLDKIKLHYHERTFYEWPKWKNKFSQVDLNDIEMKWKSQGCIKSNIKFIKGIFVPKKNKSNSVKELANFVNLYKKSWEYHDINLINKIFDHDAQYIISDTKPPLIGTSSIQNYWKNNKKLQRNVRFSPRYCCFEKNKAFCYWNSVFYRTDLKKWLLLSGQLEMNTKNSKIIHFWESFQKNHFDDKPLSY